MESEVFPGINWFQEYAFRNELVVRDLWDYSEETP